MPLQSDAGVKAWRRRALPRFPGAADRRRSAAPGTMVSVIAIIVVILHAVVVVLHAAAHRQLHVQLSILQSLYVAVVIIAAPLLSALILLTKWRHLGFALLGASMVGAFLFGGYYHYVTPSPDHVLHLPPGEAQPLFRLTAALLALSELCGIGIAVVGLAHPRSEAA
jgi:hypothetical protein